MPNTVPPRSKLDKKFTWNAESVFPSDEAWEKEVKQILADIPTVKQFQGRLAESPEVLVQALEAVYKLIACAQKVFMYAGFSYAVDTTNQHAAGMRSKAQGMYGQILSAVSYLQPELLEIGRENLDEWMDHPSGKKLAVYKHYFDDLFRKQAHVRSAEVEELLGLANDPLQGPEYSTSVLTNADFKFKPAKDSAGKIFDLTQGTYHKILQNPDRKARRTAYENYMDKYVEHKNTLAANLSNSIKANVFQDRK